MQSLAKLWLVGLGMVCWCGLGHAEDVVFDDGPNPDDPPALTPKVVRIVEVHSKLTTDADGLTGIEKLPLREQVALQDAYAAEQAYEKCVAKSLSSFLNFKNPSTLCPTEAKAYAAMLPAEHADSILTDLRTSLGSKEGK